MELLSGQGNHDMVLELDLYGSDGRCEKDMARERMVCSGKLMQRDFVQTG